MNSSPKNRSGCVDPPSHNTCTAQPLGVDTDTQTDRTTSTNSSIAPSSSSLSVQVLEPTTQRKTPSSRLSRLAGLTKLSPKALPFALRHAKRVMGLVHTEQQEQIARERAYQDAKKAGVALLHTLGEMKGLPMKIGQMFSYIDGLAPDGYDEKVKRMLQRLQEKAPALSPEASEQTFFHEFGCAPQQAFASWQRQPFAAASIGQVHQATTHAEVHVAVKVQYPGIDKAVQNDLKSLAMLEKILSPLGRPYHSKQMLQEIASVLTAELDYLSEARNTELFRRLFANTTTIIIPAVHHALSTRRVLTTSFLVGASYESFRKQASQQQRNEAGKIIWTFMMRSLLQYGVLYADPHPGNYRFAENGSVGFIDFGCIRILPKPTAYFIKKLMCSAIDRDWQQFDELFAKLVGITQHDKDNWELYRSYLLELLYPIMTDKPYQCTPQAAKETVQFLIRGHQHIMAQAPGRARLPAPVHLPAELTFVNRLQWGLSSILAGLGTIARFRELTEPWIRSPLKPLPITITSNDSSEVS